jgi:hypothetical protein
MMVFAVATLPLIEKSKVPNLLQKWYADDSAGVGSVEGAGEWFSKIKTLGPTMGYNVNLEKTVALVKRSALEKYQRLFAATHPIELTKIRLVILEELENMDGQTTCAQNVGSRYLGAGIGGEVFENGISIKKSKNGQSP